MLSGFGVTALINSEDLLVLLFRLQSFGRKVLSGAAISASILKRQVLPDFVIATDAEILDLI
jgi:hypothetical protein